MKKYNIELSTLTDVKEFVDITTKLTGNITLTNGKDFRVSARSLLGAIATAEWDNIYVESDEDIYLAINKFIIDR